MDDISVGNQSRPGCPGPTLLDLGVDISIVSGPVGLLMFNLFMSRTANKTAKIICNNNLFNEQTQIFVIFNMFFVAANVDGNELESHRSCAEVYVLHVLLLPMQMKQWSQLAQLQALIVIQIFLI